MSHRFHKEQNAYKIHLLILYCQLNNQNESRFVRLNTDRTDLSSVGLQILRKWHLEETSTKHQSFSCFAPHRRRPILTIGQNDRINDFTATQTPPAKKEYRTCVIPKVLKGLVDHIAFATWTFHRLNLAFTNLKHYVSYVNYTDPERRLSRQNRFYCFFKPHFYYNEKNENEIAWAGWENLERISW